MWLSMIPVLTIPQAYVILSLTPRYRATTEDERTLRERAVAGDPSRSASRSLRGFSSLLLRLQPPVRSRACGLSIQAGHNVTLDQTTACRPKDLSSAFERQ